MDKLMIIAVLLMVLMSVPVLATQSADIKVETTPTTIAPGNSGYVKILITNTGSETIDRIKISLSRADPQLIFGSTTTTELGGLGTGKTTNAVIGFSLSSSTSSGFYTAEFSVETCYDTSCTTYSQVALVSVQSPSTLQVLSVQPNRLDIGASTILNFTLLNSGNTPLNNIVLSWSANDTVLPLGTSNRLFIDTLLAGQSKTLSTPVLVSPSATPGAYAFTITADYTDQTGTEQTTNSTAGFTISGIYDWIVILDSRNTIPASGSGDATIKFSNAGNQKALFVAANASSSTFTISPDVVYIGSIDADDWSSEDFTLTASNVAPGVYPLTIGLSWKDTFGQSYSEIHNFNIQVSPQTRADWPAAIVILIIAAIAVAWFVRRSRKRKHSV